MRKYFHGLINSMPNKNDRELYSTLVESYIKHIPRAKSMDLDKVHQRVPPI